MTSPRCASVSFVVCSLSVPFATIMTGLQVGTPDPSPPTAIEQALSDYVCSATRAGTPGSDTYQECLSAKLQSLRADFGRDLGRLSAAERKTIDAVCSKVSATRGREGYVACLSDQLVTLSNRRSRARPAASQAPTPSPSVSAASAIPAAPVGQPSWRPYRVWIGVTLVTVFAAAGGALFVAKRRRAPTRCKTCGRDVTGAGDLCQACRHEAAETLRRAATERVDHDRALEVEERQKREREEARRQQAVLQEEEARRRQQEDARHREEETRQKAEETRQREEAARQRQEAGDSPEALDPYAVLGVAREASREQIDAAYQAARAKYDLEQVAFLGEELQALYKEKAQAVERAYQMIAASR